MAHDQLPSQVYILKGGADGSARLRILSEALEPSTRALLDRMGPLNGKNIVDAASGGGDVALMLAERAGPNGHVSGFDLDAQIVSVAQRRAMEARMGNLRFMVADVTKPWLVERTDAVYARFILTHLARPEDMLAQAYASLVEGGMIAIEDIDAEGCFWDPPHDAPAKLRQLYVAVAKARGGDPTIGRRLHRLLEDAGFKMVGADMVHLFGASGPAKMSFALVAPAIADAAVALGLIGRTEMELLTEDILAYAARRDTVMAMPRVFQALAQKT